MAKKKKIVVSERVNSFGNQVFTFKLANGRWLRLEFSPHLTEPGGDECAVAVSLMNRDARGPDMLDASLPITISEHGKEIAVVSHPCLWVATPQDRQRHGKQTRDMIEGMRDSLLPPDEPPTDDDPAKS